MAFTFFVSLSLIVGRGFYLSRQIKVAAPLLDERTPAGRALVGRLRRLPYSWNHALAGGAFTALGWLLLDRTTDSVLDFATALSEVCVGALAYDAGVYLFRRRFRTATLLRTGMYTALAALAFAEGAWH
ncbi:hypothetical protein AB0D59_06130 [Streptomyces sp. NPDC048417]|uniref:hypothetical protein n=1 Tax=Streptomyces sp. NPDC048417 TaxID=3155387 RepID=UPI00341C4723